MRMPVMFVGHGSPMNAIEDNDYTRTWERIGQRLPKPKSILAISAHWYIDGVRTSDVDVPRQIYDMYGFPEALYTLKYPVNGDKTLAESITKLLGEQCRIDNRWGIDHGTWSVLCKMFPEADIPTVQLSVDMTLPPENHYAIGRLLRALREEGVLILASGNVVHNLSLVSWGMKGGYPWAEDFDKYVKENILKENHEAVIHYEHAGNIAGKAFYTPDHYLPLLYAIGAAFEGEAVEVFNDSCIMGALSMTSYLIG